MKDVGSGAGVKNISNLVLKEIDGVLETKNPTKEQIKKCKKKKIGNMFVNEKILEEYSVNIYKIDPYFYEHYGKKYKLMKMGLYLYISFRIDVYFTEYLLVVEVDEKGHTDRDLIFEEKRQKH